MTNSTPERQRHCIILIMTAVLQTLTLASAGSYVSEAGSGVAPAVSDLSEGDDITLTCDAVTTGGLRPRVKWSKQVTSY